jgi:hypothetical protein
VENAALAVCVPRSEELGVGAPDGLAHGGRIAMLN